jgi:PAS domain S-box-containing protein
MATVTGSIVVVDERHQVEHAWLIHERGTQEGTSPFVREIIAHGLTSWTMRLGETMIVDDTQHDERWLAPAGSRTAIEPWSAICTPLIVRSRAIGAITMTRPGRSKFGRPDVELLEAIAGQAATIIESARLYRESRQRAEALAGLVRATAAVSSSLDREQVLQRMAEQMAALLQADGCLIFGLDEASRALTPRLFHSASGSHPEILADEMLHLSPPQTDLMWQLLDKAGSVRLKADDPRLTREQQERIMAASVSSIVIFPLVAQEEPLGLVVLFDRGNELLDVSAQKEDFARTLANHAAIAVQNARLYEESQRQLRVSALLNQASQVINSSLDTDKILQSLLAQMNELLNAEAISIALVDPQQQELVYTVAEGAGSEAIVGLRVPSNQGVSGWVMKFGEPTLVSDMAQDARFYPEGDRRTGQVTRAMICAPLRVKDKVLGTIQAINPKKGPFTENDLQLLVNLANLASSALNNAQQFALTQAAEERYVSLFDDSITPILLTDHEGRIIEANRQASAFTGYSHQELVQMPVSALHHFEADEGLPLLEAIPAERAVTFTGRILTADRHTIPVEGFVKRTVSADAELLQWIYRDVSEQLALEEMRGDLMAMLVHDLQSPLGNVISSLELMRYELPDDGDQVLNSIVDIAVRSSNRLQTLIRSLLDITHLEAGLPVAGLQYTNLPALIAESYEAVEPMLRRRRTDLIRDIPENLPPVYVDADMIRRVFVNLLDNASKYTPEGSPVTIAVAPPDDGGRLLVSVSDRGEGIPLAQRDAVFEKFRRLESGAASGPKGMGLGLAFCRLAVEAHGGGIWVDEAPGGGSRFNFTLPTHSFYPLPQPRAHV